MPMNKKQMIEMKLMNIIRPMVEQVLNEQGKIKHEVDVEALLPKLKKAFPNKVFKISGNVWQTEDKQLFHKYFWDGFGEYPKTHLNLRKSLNEPNLIIDTPSEYIVTFTLD